LPHQGLSAQVTPLSQCERGGAANAAGVSVIVKRLHSSKPFIAVLSVFYPMFDQIYPDTIDLTDWKTLHFGHKYVMPLDRKPVWFWLRRLSTRNHKYNYMCVIYISTSRTGITCV